MNRNLNCNEIVELGKDSFGVFRVPCDEIMNLTNFLIVLYLFRDTNKDREVLQRQESDPVQPFSESCFGCDSDGKNGIISCLKFVDEDVT